MNDVVNVFISFRARAWLRDGIMNECNGRQSCGRDSTSDKNIPVSHKLITWFPYNIMDFLITAVCHSLILQGTVQGC